MNRVLIVEDNPVFMALLERAIERLELKSSISRCSTGDEALKLIEDPSIKIDLALIDLGLPDTSGIFLIEAMRRRFPQQPVLVISVFTSEDKVVAAIRAGARGYITKSQSELFISQSIHEVLLGNYPISPSLARSLFRLAGSPQTEITNPFNLTPREMETLHLLSRGNSYSEVARIMGVTISTVQSNIRNLYRKMEVRSQVQAITKAKDNGVI